MEIGLNFFNLHFSTYNFQFEDIPRLLGKYLR